MSLKQYNLYNILKFLPGLVILIFGMFALHSTVLIIELVGDLEMYIPDRFNGNEFIVYLRQKETLLYWSVITIGLSGFLLIVLNSSKLSKLKRINKEKRSLVQVLEGRLSALEVAQEGIFIVDDDGLISYMNRSLYVINGLGLNDREKFIGKEWLSIFSKSDREVLEENILSEFSVTGCWVGDFSMYRSDGSIVHVDLSLTILPDGGLIGTIQDVSEKHKAENEKKDLEEQFYQAQKMEAIGRLAGGIAHDFNNILAAMNGYADFIKEDMEKDSVHYKYADNILQAGSQARDLVDQMMAFSRTSGSECKSLDLVVSVSEAVTMLQATLPKSVELNKNFLIPYAPILGNQTQLSQLIMNLCVNAMDAMEDEAGVHSLNVCIEKVSYDDIGYSDFIREKLPNPKEAPEFRINDVKAGQTRLFLGHIAEGQSYVKLTVQDTGMGMGRIVMEHIFEPFFTTKPVDKGTGLGLSTVHGIVVSHMGFMIIDSILGQGTSFDIYFPLAEEIQDSRKEKDEEHEQKVVNSEPSLIKKHILLVEDQDSVRLMVLELLRRSGYETSYALSGLDGLDMVREEPEKFDLIITDYNMPKMTGIEMVQQIHLDLPDLPFILMSGYSEDRVKEIIEGHEAIKAVIRKPVSSDVLASKIQAIIGE